MNEKTNTTLSLTNAFSMKILFWDWVCVISVTQGVAILLEKLLKLGQPTRTLPWEAKKSFECWDSGCLGFVISKLAGWKRKHENSGIRLHDEIKQIKGAARNQNKWGQSHSKDQEEEIIKFKEFVWEKISKVQRSGWKNVSKGWEGGSNFKGLFAAQIGLTQPGRNG